MYVGLERDLIAGTIGNYDGGVKINAAVHLLRKPSPRGYQYVIDARLPRLPVFSDINS